MIEKKVLPWERITGKPSSYPPAQHQHSDADLLGIDWSKILNKPFVKGDYVFYVDPVNGDDSNLGTSDAPWETLTPLQNLPIIFGNVDINVVPGTYSTNLSASGLVVGNLALHGTDVTLEGTIFLTNPLGSGRVDGFNIILPTSQSSAVKVGVIGPGVFSVDVTIDCIQQQNDAGYTFGVAMNRGVSYVSGTIKNCWTGVWGDAFATIRLYKTTIENSVYGVLSWFPGRVGLFGQETFNNVTTQVGHYGVLGGES